MPELPEVETIRRGLEEHLVGHTIQEVYVKDPKIFQGDKESLFDGTVTKVKRVGKGLIIEIDNGFALAVHVKMTGQLIYRDLKTANLPLSPKTGGEHLPNKYTRVIFALDRGANLFYNDLRRFGWIKVLRLSEVLNLPFFKEMGPEPFKNLTVGYMQKLFAGINIPVKVLLMDQSRIGGIGNIYANDALYESGIDPRRKASELKHQEIEKLHKAIHSVMEQSLKFGASSAENYVDALGQEGRYQEHFKVYSKDGQKCGRCAAEIKRIKQSGRSTFFCEGCQI